MPVNLSYKDRVTRFHTFVDRTTTPQGCWPWTGHCGKRGYGQTYMATRQPARTHRVAWMLANGPIPDGTCILHTCDNTGCCNPSHLYLGTTQDNSADMVRKSRARNATTKERV